LGRDNTAAPRKVQKDIPTVENTVVATDMYNQVNVEIEEQDDGQ
jgi:hypothetical protein